MRMFEQNHADRSVEASAAANGRVAIIYIGLSRGPESTRVNCEKAVEEYASIAASYGIFWLRSKGRWTDDG